MASKQIFDKRSNNPPNPGQSNSESPLLHMERRSKDSPMTSTTATASRSRGDNGKKAKGRGRALETGTDQRDDRVLCRKALGTPSMTVIKDEQVQVNLAMADLMAYLQVVANNSQHLPISRRDDPDVDGLMTDLTGEDYSRKSAAFIPADVRVIGGSFLKYGKVWDLPTSDEYTALDGAQEPGE